MRRAVSRIITIVAFCAVMAAVFALPAPARSESSAAAYLIGQVPPPGGGDVLGPDGLPLMPPGDSTEEKIKIRKPLESYFFGDELRQQGMFAWNVSLLRNEVRTVGVDTAINSVQVSYPFMRKGVGEAYQGPLGGASIALNYMDRPQYRDFAFAQAFDAYNIFPETAKFYNVKKPFTLFSYYGAGQTSKYEEGFSLTHAQNISPSSGFNLDYKSQGTRGLYDWSKARDKNLSMAFSHTGKKYSLHAGYIYNAVNNKENGGITDDRFITDTIMEIPANIPVHLMDARNKIKGNTFYLVQSYGFPLRKLADDDFSIADYSSLFVGHSMTYARWNKVYTDTRAASSYQAPVAGGAITDIEVSDFYENWYISPTATYDSIAETSFSNRAFIQIQPFDREGVVGLIDAGFGIDHHQYYTFATGDYLTGRREPVSRTDSYVYGAIDGKFKRYFDWGGDLLFHPFGDRSGDLEVGARASLSAFIKGRPVTLSGKFRMERRSPGYWTERMFSNHFAWSNSFSKETETRLDVRLTIPDWALEVGGMQSVVTDRIYYGADALPAQHSGTTSVTGLYADKDFRFGGWHLRHRVLLQWSTQEEIIPVPLASAYLSYYYEFDVVKNVLRAQVGIDARYNTKYYAFGYMPATAQFYNQREKEIGGYPMLDVFVSAKWKRMRILLKMEHVNQDLVGGRNYFTLLHYPQLRRVFKFGFSWAFYD